MDSNAKNYELAYVLSSALAEDAVLPAGAKLTALIEECGGMMKRAETPKKRRLAYVIKKEANGYFGWTTFSMAPDAVAALEKKVKEDNNLLRHLIVEEEIETRVPFVRPLGGRRPQAMHHAAAPFPTAPEAPGEKLDLEALDKKLEEILGK